MSPPRAKIRQRPKGPINPAMGHRFRQLRQAAGMTQAEVALARKLGVPLAELLPDGARAATIFPKGVDGELQEAVGLMNHGIEFSLSARTALVGFFQDYTRAKTNVRKIQELTMSAPVPNDHPKSVKAWMTRYQAWLRAVRSEAFTVPYFTGIRRPRYRSS